MSTDRPGLGPILLTVALDLVGFGLVIPLLSFYAETYGASALQVTLLMAVYSLAQFLMAPVWGSLSDRYGRRPVLLFSIAATSAMLVLFALAPSLWVLFLARALHGAAAANISTAQAYVADITTPENRAKGMGLIGASIGLGFTIGPFLGGELAGFGHRVPILVAAGLSALNFVWAYTRLAESRSPENTASHRPRTLDPRAMVRGLTHPVVGLAITLTFLAVFAFAMMEGTLALVAEHRWSWNEADVGRLLGAVGVIGIVVQGGLLGRLVKRFGESPLVSVGYGCMAVGFAILSVATGAEIWLAVGFLGIGNSLAVPSLNALISKATAADEQGAILGVNQSMSALGAGVRSGHRWPAVHGVVRWRRAGRGRRLDGARPRPLASGDPAGSCGPGLMREPYRVETGLDRTEVYIRKPPVLRHHQPIFVLSAVALVAGLVWIPLLIGPGVLGAVLGAVVARRAPAEHHLLVLGPGGFEVDGKAFETGSLSLILTDEKIVLRDEERQAELWHGIPRLSSGWRCGPCWRERWTTQAASRPRSGPRTGRAPAPLTHHQRMPQVTVRIAAEVAPRATAVVERRPARSA